MELESSSDSAQSASCMGSCLPPSLVYWPPPLSPTIGRFTVRTMDLKSQALSLAWVLPSLWEEPNNGLHSHMCW